MTAQRKREQDERIRQLELDLDALREAFNVAISWICQSAGSPLSVNNGRQLQEMAKKVQP